MGQTVQYTHIQELVYTGTQFANINFNRGMDK